MIKVALQGAEFFAYHGFYAEEQLLGTRFLVDIETYFTPVSALHEDEISKTVDYQTLYNITSAEMKQPRNLIETVAQHILDAAIKQFPFVEKAVVTVKKMHPAMGGIVNNSAVTITYNKTSNDL
ncbi:dihydroneopterin aldolase [Mucilaginibacter pallidiroseus]|uniref:7,8-dihydroneopterin aldolase n=1 Tax=Mucilaginibacter pallidiroseus TaxID=2599295 RepID=A0A563UJ50_9SPHI|nr:dihydroneopterin aldolase [Mucilaginibacter pallidiroseus]TWR31333.1 dihydroneopterin aldolase [Mucilaginibacter pallidiroseus]